MTNHSNGMSKAEIASTLRALRKLAFYSEADDCSVVRIVCDKCDQTFEEEFDVARAKAMVGREFLCLACDPDAAERSFVGVTVRIGLYSE